MGLPALKSKYNTRSALFEELYPTPSDGKLRAMFYAPVMGKSPKRTRGNSVAKIPLSAPDN